MALTLAEFVQSDASDRLLAGAVETFRVLRALARTPEGIAARKHRDRCPWWRREEDYNCSTCLRHLNALNRAEERLRHP